MAELFEEHTKSLNSLSWKIKPCDDDEVSAIALTEDIPEIVARLMVARGITKTTAHDFLYATLKSNLPDPDILKDCKKAAEKVATFIKAKKTIGIFGDYDVDGATSTSLLYLFFKSLGVNCIFHIPERSEGYGPNTPALDKMLEDGADLIITVDCGTSADEPLNRIGKKGIPVIVIDHHEPDTTHAPEVFALINPKRIDESITHPCRKMAAVGVAFMFVISLNRTLREMGFYESKPEPNLSKWLDIVALGTVCDVVDLNGVNRLLVKSGLKVLAMRSNIGLRALVDAAGIKEPPSVYHMGFVLGPRINAGGRIGTSELGTRLLTTTNEDEAKDIALKLCELNTERQQMEAYVLTEAIEQIERNPEPSPIAFAFGKSWHAGVIGIVAGRLKERYHLPAFVIGSDETDPELAHGSCRSIHGVDIGSTIMDALAHGIITKGGGHTMAAGFSLTIENIDKAKEFFTNHILSQINHQDTLLESILELDGLLDIGALENSLIEKLSLLEPYGEGNPEPIFAIKNVNLFFLGIRGQGHIACNISSLGGKTVKGIAFRAADTLLGKSIMESRGEPFHIAGRLRINEWQGRKSVEFTIIDAIRA